MEEKLLNEKQSKEAESLKGKIASIGVKLSWEDDCRNETYTNHYTSRRWFTDIEHKKNEYIPAIRISFYDNGRTTYTLYGKLNEYRYVGEKEEELLEKVKELRSEGL